MARRRYLSTEISKDKRVYALTERAGDFAAMLYTWMLPHAEDDGSITADHDEIVALVVPFLLGRRRFDVRGKVAAAVAAMLDLTLLIEEDGRYYFPPDSFYRYQSYIKPEHRRKTPESTVEQRESPQNAASVPVPISVPISVSFPVKEEREKAPEHPFAFMYSAKYQEAHGGRPASPIEHGAALALERE